MNFLNNSLVAAGAKIRVGTRAGVGLRDGAGEVIPEWGPPTGLGSLASSSTTGSVGGRFRQGERPGWDLPGIISVADLIGLMNRSFSKQAG